MQAAANAFGLRILLITSYEESFVISIDPAVMPSGSRILYLSFWAEVHYNSIYPATDPPRHPADTPDAADTKPKKLLGSRRLGKFISDMSS
eukprot:CAMPEP_0117658172 /NCGR_PEP_ID=MMETSP0804-20121206/5723_1 /TAXON_ID=1074897 /ORGANISM="Tetraselmis astigmatica, Strain CCMP880" /LENGTH=90 /DNA_ID=CAMNT_0005464677 /DNA_START=296 /DNA_END=568 /DNA_ORIENTATION=+